MASKKIFLITVILFIVAAIIGYLVIFNLNENSIETKLKRDKTEVNETPAETISKFTSLMFSGTGKGDNTKSLAKALNLIEPNPDIKISNQKNQLLKEAKELFLILHSVNYSLDQIKTIKTTAKTKTIELGENESTIKIYLTFSNKLGWIFSRKNFSGKGLNSAIKHINNITKNLTEHANDFIPDLSSPLNTAYTFTFGVQDKFGFTMDDAIRALDLSHFDAVVVDELGPTWAIQVFRILSFASPIKPESLSNDPLYDGNVILLLDPDYGMLGMKIVTDPKTNKKAWKIEYSGTSNITSAYDSYMHIGMTNELGKNLIKNRPLHIILDDFFQLHIPFLEKKILGYNLWKYLATIVLLLSSLIIAPLIKALILPILNFILEKFHATSSKETNKRFILPLQISVIAFIWLQGIVEITANPHIISLTVIALNIVLCFAISLLICRIIDAFTNIASDKFNTALHIITSVIGKLLKLAVIIAAALYICDILGIDTKNFLAALGIGGFAVALAGKDTMENFFGSIMIIIDRQFNNGDVVKINNIEGTIEQVSVRSTRIRTFDNSVVTVPNRMFISSSVENTSMRQWRRYKTTFNILHNTDVNKINEFISGLTELAHLIPDSKKDQIQIYFYSLESTSIQIFVSIFFRNRGRVEELKARQTFNTQAISLAQELEVNFAYPTQTINISNDEVSENNINKQNLNSKSKQNKKTNVSGIELARKISPYNIDEN